MELREGGSVGAREGGNERGKGPWEGGEGMVLERGVAFRFHRNCLQI